MRRGCSCTERVSDQSSSGRRRCENPSGARQLDLAKDRLTAFEVGYGPYPHDALIIWFTASLEMEHAGVVETTGLYTSHEIRHQWFGREFMPASGPDE